MKDQEILTELPLVKKFRDISLKDVAAVGGKNASLGEMFNQLQSRGVQVPDGFATTSAAYGLFLDTNKLREKIAALMKAIDKKNFKNLDEIAAKARQLILDATLSPALCDLIIKEYHALFPGRSAEEVAVRSSATAEDLPSASFAGQHESFLNIKGDADVLAAVRKCFASLFTARAIKYREDKGFDHMSIALSAGIQKMVRADKACSGVIFTLEPESGFRDVVLLTGSWGLGENIVQGAVTPDEYLMFKPSLKNGKKAIISRKLGSKAKTMVYREVTGTGTSSVINTETAPEKQAQFILQDEDVELLGRWALAIEEHYKSPMDIEWAKDGIAGGLFVVQARPETVESRRDPYITKEYTLTGKANVLASGLAVGRSIASGKARVLENPSEAASLQPGEILITTITSPDWDPILKKAAAIVTSKGGRTSHASIVARELGVTAIVGAGDNVFNIKNGQEITVSCAEGKTGNVYAGLLSWAEKEIDFRAIALPATRPMLILGDPEKAFQLSFYPNAGVGLMRLEFVISNSIRIHPMALVHFDKLTDAGIKKEIDVLTRHYPDKEAYFTDKLSQAVATIASAFYPKEVIVRMSDFKTNEYANLLGGKDFEPGEENPMLGFRGASRYYHERYKEGFRLECIAMRKVRDDMGFNNVKLMLPFCRTVEEVEKVLAVMAEYGLSRHKDGLEIYMMVEIPSNVILADEFAKLVDGFSIGSNDLTQLTLGIDRDSAIISDVFNEQDEAVTRLISWAIAAAKKNKIKIGLCGQAPSDRPDFAKFLVKQGIDSISFNSDALIAGINNINMAEAEIEGNHAHIGFLNRTHGEDNVQNHLF